jgi:hypothetical protein
MEHGKETRWLSRKEARGFLGVSDSTMLRHQKHGLLHPRAGRDRRERHYDAREVAELQAMLQVRSLLSRASS